MISIIIPTLNEEKALESTLKDLTLNLTIPHEIIISDGKSTDETVAIAKKYTDKVIVHSENYRQNISAGRNAGAKEAKGEFLAFMDADCHLENPDRFFSLLLERLAKDQKILAVTVAIKVFPKEETLSDRIFFGFLNNAVRFQNNVLKKGESTGEFQMIRKEAFDKVGGFREDLITREDGDMFFRLSRIGRTFFDPTLRVLHTGRRAHKIGWPKMIFLWFINSLSVFIFNKAYSKEWTVVR